MALSVDTIRVDRGTEGFSFPCISILNRRAGGAPRLLRWVYQRHLEILLFRRTDGGSSGAIWKTLNMSGLQSTSLCCSRKVVDDGHLLEAEFQQIMQVFKDALPADVCDPSSFGRIRSCTVLPVATAAAVCRAHGRSPASTAWLTAFSQSVPQAWELHDQAEQDAANGEVDLVLQDQLEQLEADQHFEVEELSFRDELITTMPPFPTVAADEQRMKTYILQRVPPILKSELGQFIAYRTATFAARRQGGAVQSITVEGDCTNLLRFYGYLDRLGRVPEGQLLYLSLLLRADLGDLVQAYVTWLQQTQRCSFSTIAGYTNSLVSVITYCYANLSTDLDDAVLSSDPSPLAQVINLRAQAEKASKTQQMYSTRVGDTCTWEDVQKARCSAMEKLDDVVGVAAMRSAARDACALSLLSLIPYLCRDLNPGLPLPPL